MGSAASSQPALTASLPAPFLRGDCLFTHCTPESIELKKHPQVLLEVGTLGFRLLRATKAEEPLFVYPWGQIHSWAHVQNNFSFRYFDDNKRAILTHSLTLNDLETLLEHIQKVVEQILGQRKSNAISNVDFQVLVDALQCRNQSCALELISKAVQDRFFMAHQGSLVLSLLPTIFDKVEAAVVLHARLVDQSRFSIMLEELEDPGDRDNVWHRITVAKRAAPCVRATTLARLSTVSTGARVGSGLNLVGVSSPVHSPHCNTVGPSSAGGAFSRNSSFSDSPDPPGSGSPSASAQVETGVGGVDKSASAVTSSSKVAVAVTASTPPVAAGSGCVAPVASSESKTSVSAAGLPLQPVTGAQGAPSLTPLPATVFKGVQGRMVLPPI